MEQAEGAPAMSITSDLVEAYSLCPRKAFLLMTGATTDPGPHAYELLIREQAEANRQAHHVRLANTNEVVIASGPADLTAGRDVLADAELAISGLQAHFDFLAKVHEPLRRGRSFYEPMRVIGTYKASRTDALGFAYEALVLGEVQGRKPASGALARLGGRLCEVQFASRYKEVRRIVETLRAWAAQPAGEHPASGR